MMSAQDTDNLKDGLELRVPDGLDLPISRGRLYFQTSMPETHSSLLRDGSYADNEILSTAMALKKNLDTVDVILVS